MKETQQTNPQIEMKAMQYVNVGYQRILTFECKSGGFNWWKGDNPGNPILSAMAIMMLTDTREVYPAVDSKVLKRTAKYLMRIQQNNGSWGQERHLHAGNENLGASALRTTCYVTWALSYGGWKKSRSVQKAIQYIEKELPQEKDDYTIALCANALVTSGKKTDLVAQMLDHLFDKAKHDGRYIYWENKTPTIVKSGGIAANVEFTSLVTLALIDAKQHLNALSKVIDWLVSTKDPAGNWGYNTQATVLALKVFLKAATVNVARTNATVTITLSGHKKVYRKKFDDFNKDVVWQVEFNSRHLRQGNRLSIRYEGTGNLGYQVIKRYFVPHKPKRRKVEPLKIEVSYDRTSLPVNDILTVSVTLLKQTKRVSGMTLVTLGIPPGFEVLTDSLVALKNAETITNFELTGRQVLLYLNDIPFGRPVTLKYKMKALYPVKAQTGESEVRLYYDHKIRSVAPSMKIVVKK